MNAKKYASIAALLQWTEFEPQEDGLFLQPEEAATVDTALANAEASQQQLHDANESIVALNTQMSTMHTQETVDALNVTITNLQAQVKELGGGASGNGTVVTTAEDEIETGAPKKALTMNDAEHPVNVAANNYLKAKENAKKVKQGV